MGEFLDAPKRLMAFPTRVESDGNRDFVTQVAVTEFDENGKPLGGTVSHYTSTCSTAIAKVDQAWAKKNDYASGKFEDAPALSQSINQTLRQQIKQAEKEATQACSANGWQWKATKTEQLSPKQIRDEAMLGDRLLNKADRSLFDAVKWELTGKPQQSSTPWDIDDPTVPNDS